MKLRRLTGAAAGLILLAAGAVACSDDESVANAEVGECIENISDLAGLISELPETECTEDHEAEVYFLFDHEGGDDDFDQSEIDEEATERCGEELEDYIGVDPSETRIAPTSINPSEGSWEDGDRETICVAFIPGEEVDESFEDNGDEFPVEGADTGDDSGDDSGDESTTTTGDAGDDEEEDTSLEDFADLVESCEGGDMADCDTLYATTPIGSEAEEIGATCGGEVDLGEIEAGTCEEELGG